MQPIIAAAVSSTAARAGKRPKGLVQTAQGRQGGCACVLACVCVRSRVRPWLCASLVVVGVVVVLVVVVCVRACE